jgi:hypothetical protein
LYHYAASYRNQGIQLFSVLDGTNPTRIAQWDDAAIKYTVMSSDTSEDQYILFASAMNSARVYQFVISCDGFKVIHSHKLKLFRLDISEPKSIGASTLASTVENIPQCAHPSSDLSTLFIAFEAAFLAVSVLDISQPVHSIKVANITSSSEALSTVSHIQTNATYSLSSS